MIFQYYAYAKRASQEPRKTASVKFLDQQHDWHDWNIKVEMRLAQEEQVFLHTQTNSQMANSHTLLSGRRWSAPFCTLTHLSQALGDKFHYSQSSSWNMEALRNSVTCQWSQLVNSRSSGTLESVLIQGHTLKPLDMKEKVTQKAHNCLLSFCQKISNIKSFFQLRKEKKYKWVRNKLETRGFRNTFQRKLPVCQF